MNTGEWNREMMGFSVHHRDESTSVFNLQWIMCPIAGYVEGAGNETGLVRKKSPEQVEHKSGRLVHDLKRQDFEVRSLYRWL